MHKIASIQMTSTPNVGENLGVVAGLIEEAKVNHARLVVLPEMFAIAGCDLKDKLMVQEKFGDGLIQNFLSDQAKIHKIWIVGGTIPISCDNPNKIRAASILYNDMGEAVARYDKMHLFDVVLSDTEVYKESEHTQPGDNVVVAKTPFGTVGLCVCYDIRFPLLFNKFAESGVDIIVVPSAFTVPTGTAHWEVMLRARAVENLSYVVGSAQAGKHANGRYTYGHSMIIEPWGGVVSELKDPKPGIVYADVDLNYLADLRKKLPVLEHKRSSY